MTQRPATVRPRHRMVDRVSGILEFVARSEGASLTEIARHVGAPVSSVQGLVNGLVATGYLDERSRVYRLGAAPHFLNLVAGRGAVNRIVHDDLVRLHERTGRTSVVLAVAIGSDIVYIDHVSDDPRTAYLAERFLRRSLIRTSSGLVLMADWEPRDLWAYLETLGDDDQSRVRLLLDELESIRATDMSVLPNIAEDPELDGISIAVREGDRVVAAVGVVGRHADLARDREQIITALREQAMEWDERD
ncbi:helix-turn-helix domain-containing protein [Gordonia hydrophobica]|uniref:Helix-turn-helix domain-containing protein n=1 Tax=Gordonia hydrophobica TaxID=40516 RepID=A0ABZ2U6Z7_9ACTN|nr:helix-turn-helix domain-containing protein [Gordonia hydrophobica]MBM7365376.1 DNA-binding IclR family transcriptional regulator [Gordonia hydrophobica]